MKKFLLVFASFIFSYNSAFAVNMVQIENYFQEPVSVVGLPDYPPFSYYENDIHERYYLKGAFIKPITEVMKKYEFPMNIDEARKREETDLLSMLIKVRSGEERLFIGIYADTKLFSGIETIYPAALSNPIHVIAIPETLDNIKSTSDLKNLKGVISKTEYLSDFVLGKIKPLNLTFVDSSYDAYELLFTGEADYIIGSLYYNKIEASKYGLGRYLAYSKKPIYKIPVFVGLSRSMPMFSVYLQAFNKEFSSAKFSNDVKTEVLRIINEFERKNEGIVPPPFVKQSAESEPEEEPSENEFEPADDFLSRGFVIDTQQQKQHKSVDELLNDL